MSSRINEAAAIAGTDAIEISNTSANSVPITITDVLGDDTILEWLQNIHSAVDELELNVDNIENISLNTGDLEALQGSDDDAGTGDLAEYAYDSTNNLLTDVRTAIQLLDDAVITLGQLVGTAKGTLIAGSDGANLRALATDANGKLQVAVTSQAPGVGASDLGKAEDSVHGSGDVGVMSLAVRKDTAAAQTNADGDYTPLLTNDEGKLYVKDADGAETAANSKSVVPATNIADGTYIGDIKFGEAYGSLAKAASLSVTLATDDNLQDVIKTEDEVADQSDKGIAVMSVRRDTAVVSNADGDYQPLLTDGTGKLHVKDAAGPEAKAASKSVTLATDDELFQTIDQTNNLVNVGSATAANFKVTETDASSIKTAVEKIDDVHKVHDAAQGNADKGVHILGVRKDTPASSGNVAEGDYSSLLTDNEGKLHVNAGPLPAQTGTVNIGDVSLAPSIAHGGDLTLGGGTDGLAVGGRDSGDDFQMLNVETDGTLNVLTELTTEDYDTDVGDTENVAVVGLVTPAASGPLPVDGTNKLPVDTGLTTVAALGEQAQTGSLSVTLATDDDLLNCVDKSTSELAVEIKTGGFDGQLTGGTASIGKVEVTAMPTTAVTGTFWQATQNTSQVQTAVYTDQVTVSTASGGAALGTTQALGSGITVVADAANTATVYVGGTSGLSATTGFPLAAGAGFTFSLDDRAALFAFTASTNQKINYVAM